MSLFLELIWAHLCLLIIGENILITGEGLTQWLDDTTLTTEAKYPINFTQSRKRFVLSLDYNENNGFLFVNATKIYRFEAKGSEIKNCALCLGNILKDFTIIKTKKTWLKGVVNFFSVDFSPIDTNDILHIHKYLLKRAWYKIMFGIIKKMFIVLWI